MRIRHFLILATLAAAAICCSSSPAPAVAASQGTAPRPVANVPPGYGDELPYTVDRIDDAVLHDARRDKDLHVAVEYPKGAGGPFPVIVFSHGFGASKDAYRSLTLYWASHGYVVVKPTHADSQTVSDIRDLLDESSVFEKQNEFDWRNRARDISLVIDSLPDLEHRYFPLRGKMDLKKIGVGGHSYGAFTTMLVAGAKISTSGTPLAVRDPRVMAGLAMSPQGVSPERGTTQDSWENVRIPMMYMTGTLDRGTGETPQWRRDPFQYGVPGDKYFISINGARHLSFTGRFADRMAAMGGDSPFGPPRPGTDPNIPTTDPTSPTTNPRDPRYQGSVPAQSRRYDNGAFREEPAIFAAVRRLSLAFWDAYLKGSDAGKQYLATDLVAKESKVKLAMERK